MISQKSHSLKLFLWKNFFTLTAAFCATFLSVSFYSNEASALFCPDTFGFRGSSEFTDKWKSSNK